MLMWLLSFSAVKFNDCFLSPWHQTTVVVNSAVEWICGLCWFFSRQQGVEFSVFSLVFTLLLSLFHSVCSLIVCLVCSSDRLFGGTECPVRTFFFVPWFLCWVGIFFLFFFFLVIFARRLVAGCFPRTPADGRPWRSQHPKPSRRDRGSRRPPETRQRHEERRRRRIQGGVRARPRNCRRDNSVASEAKEAIMGMRKTVRAGMYTA